MPASRTRALPKPTRWSRRHSSSAAIPASTTSRAPSSRLEPGEQRLTVYQGTQAPHMTQNLFAKHSVSKRARCASSPRTSALVRHQGAHLCDEMATAALAKLLKRPVKFVADRLESFVTDIHARDHRVKAKSASRRRHDHRLRDRRSDRIGPYSVYPRTSGSRPTRSSISWAPLHLSELPRPRPRRIPEQECHVPIRAVGHPIATAVTEAVELRR